MPKNAMNPNHESQVEAKPSHAAFPSAEGGSGRAPMEAR